MDLGRIAAAGELLEKGVGNLECFARNRSESTIRYMRLLLLKREVNQACTVGNMVLPTIFSLSSARVVNELQKFCEDLRGYPSAQAASEFLDTVAAHMTRKRH
jgi:hypothetical protein